MKAGGTRFFYFSKLFFFPYFGGGNWVYTPFSPVIFFFFCPFKLAVLGWGIGAPLDATFGGPVK